MLLYDLVCLPRCRSSVRPSQRRSPPENYAVEDFSGADESSVVLVCPNCSNALTFSRGPSTHFHPAGINRFECRTCPYTFEVVKNWTEKTGMKEKEVEEVFGGEDEWKNADSCESKWSSRRPLWDRKLIMAKLNAQLKAAMASGPTFTRCRFEVRTNR